MKNELVQSIIKENRQGYNQIAEKFSQTRRFPWSEFKYFESYVKSGFNILDAGSGSGRLYNFLKNKNIQYQGIDASTNLIKISKDTYPEASFREGDITVLPYNNDLFNLIFCVATLHHVPSGKLRAQTIREFNRVLKPGGYLLMTNWNLLSSLMWPTLARFTLKKIIGQNKLDWMDITKPWKDNYGNIQTSRYLHAFTKGNMGKLLLNNGFASPDQFYTARELKTGILSGYNLVTIARKA